MDLLVERRYIERSQLLEALRLQTYRLLQQLLRWNQGDFKFYSGDEVSFEEGFVPISVEDLLLNSAAFAPEATPAAAPPPKPQPVPVPPPQPVMPAPAPVPRTAAPAPRPVLEPGPPPVAAPRPIAPRIAPVAPPDSTPEPGGSFRQMKVEARPVPPRSFGWVGRTLAALLAAVVVVSLLRLPDTLMIPFPWQQREREDLVRDQRASLYLKIDRAAKTWFLLKGSFPDHLQDLVAAGLLSSDDLQDPEGRPLRYAAAEESYTLQPLAGGKPVPDAETTDAITGNFLLDPEFLNAPSESTAAPLVLLD